METVKFFFSQKYFLTDLHHVYQQSYKSKIRVTSIVRPQEKLRRNSLAAVTAVTSLNVPRSHSCSCTCRTRIFAGTAIFKVQETSTQTSAALFTLLQCSISFPSASSPSLLNVVCPRSQQQRRQSTCCLFSSATRRTREH